MFIPALSFVRLAGAVGAVRKLWFLLFNMGVAIAVGTVLGTSTASLVFPRRRRRGRRGVAGAYRPRGDERESLRKVVAAAAAFGNMANLPLVLVSALCSGESARTVLFSSSPSGPPSRAQCSATAEEYVMAPIAVASVMQVGRRGFEGKGREREREKREREREKKRAKGALRRKKKGRKNSLFLCAHSVPSFCPQTHTNKNKQFMLAEAILRGKGQRKGREEATRPPSARAARTARGATTPASPPRQTDRATRGNRCRGSFWGGSAALRVTNLPVSVFIINIPTSCSTQRSKISRPCSTKSSNEPNLE